jgi:hypothetical protein
MTTTDISVQIVNAFFNGCCLFAAAMQANPTGAFVLLVMTVCVVFGLWLHKRPGPPSPPRQSPRPSVKKKPRQSQRAHPDD